MTDFGQPGYGGPVPAGKAAQYYFKLYALIKTKFTAGASRTGGKCYEGHIIAKGELMGNFRDE